VRWSLGSPEWRTLVLSGSWFVVATFTYQVMISNEIIRL
jgi:hypothetical protein